MSRAAPGDRRPAQIGWPAKTPIPRISEITGNLLAREEEFRLMQLEVQNCMNFMDSTMSTMRYVDSDMSKSIISLQIDQTRVYELEEKNHELQKKVRELEERNEDLEARLMKKANRVRVMERSRTTDLARSKMIEEEKRYNLFRYEEACVRIKDLESVAEYLRVQRTMWLRQFGTIHSDLVERWNNVYVNSKVSLKYGVLESFYRYLIDSSASIIENCRDSITLAEGYDPALSALSHAEANMILIRHIALVRGQKLSVTNAVHLAYSGEHRRVETRDMPESSAISDGSSEEELSHDDGYSARAKFAHEEETVGWVGGDRSKEDLASEQDHWSHFGDGNWDGAVKEVEGDEETDSESSEPPAIDPPSRSGRHLLLRQSKRRCSQLPKKQTSMRRRVSRSISRSTRI